jgi:murein DD-endopeptidase MepM/ murein hydrolase activator NlpD
MAVDSAGGRPLARRGFLAAVAGLSSSALTRGFLVPVPLSRHAAPIVGLSAATPFAFLSTASTPQGTAFSVRVRGDAAASGTATFNDQVIPLLPLDGYLVAALAAGQAAGYEIELGAGDYSVHVDLQTAGGAALAFDLPITVSTTAFPVDAIVLPPSLNNLLDPTVATNEAAQLTKIYAPQTPVQLWAGLWRMPVAGPITTQFGQARSYNGGPVSGHHSGVDIGVNLGTPIAACATGIVAWTGMMAERGNFTAIDHGFGIYSGYAHQSQIGVSVGQAVQQGDIIGKAGSTGLSTGPHVHWECAVNGLNVDALRWTRVLLP